MSTTTYVVIGLPISALIICTIVAAWPRRSFEANYLRHLSDYWRERRHTHSTELGLEELFFRKFVVKVRKEASDIVVRFPHNHMQTVRDVVKKHLADIEAVNPQRAKIFEDAISCARIDDILYNDAMAAVLNLSRKKRETPLRISQDDMDSLNTV